MSNTYRPLIKNLFTLIRTYEQTQLSSFSSSLLWSQEYPRNFQLVDTVGPNSYSQFFFLSTQPTSTAISIKLSFTYSILQQPALIVLSMVPCPKCGKMNHSPPLDPLYPLEFDTWPTYTITPDYNGLIMMTPAIGRPARTNRWQATPSCYETEKVPRN